MFSMVNAAERDKEKTLGGSESGLADRDFYSRFLDAKLKDPSIPDW